MPETCQHYWVIEPPNGPISKGVCKLCSAEKNFRNWQTQKEYSEWGCDSTDSLIVPMGENSMDLIAKLINGNLEAVSGIKC